MRAETDIDLGATDQTLGDLATVVDALCLRQANLDHLARIVPLVHSGGYVEAFIALEPDQRPVQRLGEDLGNLRLADARLAFEQIAHFADRVLAGEGHELRVVPQGLTEGGEAHPARGALEQAGADMILEDPNLPADCGLGHAQQGCGRQQAAQAVQKKKPAICAFGGSGFDTLFVTSIRPGGDLSDQPLAGGVFALRPGVRGLPEPACTFF